MSSSFLKKLEKQTKDQGKNLCTTNVYVWVLDEVLKEVKEDEEMEDEEVKDQIQE